MKVKKYSCRVFTLMRLLQHFRGFKYMLLASPSIFTMLLNCGRAVNRNNGVSLFLIRRWLLMAEIVTLPSMSSFHLEAKHVKFLGF